MPSFRIYMALSLDGYIATPDGGVAWLDYFQGEDFGYGDFIKNIDALIMGRKTYDQVLSFGDWPYPEQHTYVLSSQAIENPPKDVEGSQEDALSLSNRLKGIYQKDIWIVGGAQMVHTFLQNNMIDEMELFIMPLLLGAGIPMFKSPFPLQAITLKTAHSYKNGVVKLHYICNH